VRPCGQKLLLVRLLGRLCRTAGGGPCIRNRRAAAGFPFRQRRGLIYDRFLSPEFKQRDNPLQALSIAAFGLSNHVDPPDCWPVSQYILHDGSLVVLTAGGIPDFVTGVLRLKRPERSLGHGQIRHDSVDDDVSALNRPDRRTPSPNFSKEGDR